MRTSIAAVMTVLVCMGAAFATPSTQVWIPSTDIQKYKTAHLNIDSYLSAGKESNGTRKAPLSMIGPTVGFLSYEKIQAEAGFDLMYQGVANDNYPLYLHGKAGTQENVWFKGSPAFALGVYNAGLKSGKTNQDILYAMAAKTLSAAGRFSAGYYRGNNTVLVDENGKKAADGLLLSWDRTISEVSDKLWAAVDYQGGDSALGALNFGVFWAFAPNTGVIFGYDIYNNKKTAGRNTYTVQVDINFP
ncbi:MAG: hypothetical protein NTX59_05335 [Elusimicrobia bacterium]|nr:hypothetical protein [Elusimicrobiota bacterium]